MAVTFRVPPLPSEFVRQLQEAADDVLHGNWRITLLQSRLDGQWNLQVESEGTRARIVIGSLHGLTTAALAEIFTELTIRIQTEAEATAARSRGALPRHLG